MVPMSYYYELYKNLGGTVLSSKTYLDGTVATSKIYLDGIVPSSKMYLHGTVLSTIQNGSWTVHFKIKFQPSALGWCEHCSTRILSKA
jgi:hypothetical protein